MANISEMNRVYKTNMTDILDHPVVLKKHATTKYYRELEGRARSKGIFRRNGMDDDNGVWFEATVNGKVYRYTFCFQFSTHSLDTLAVEQ